VSLDQLIESQIQDAMAAGAFSNLPGAGKPLPPTDAEKLAGENWLGFKVLQNGGMLPEWLTLGREIELDQQALERLDAEHSELVNAATASGDWRRFEAAIAYAERRFAERARELRKKQDRFNVKAPGPRSQRPGIWVEFHIERLRQRAEAARKE
jgi:hypothetical protein